jgi:predicted DNA-binding transcriptional regulator AlpA
MGKTRRQGKEARMANDMQLLNEAELASRLKISRSLARKWRRNKEGPPFVKLGKSVRYAAEDLAEWVQKHKAA